LASGDWRDSAAADDDNGTGRDSTHGRYDAAACGGNAKNSIAARAAATLWLGAPAPTSQPTDPPSAKTGPTGAEDRGESLAAALVMLCRRICWGCIASGRGGAFARGATAAQERTGMVSRADFR